MSYTVDSLLLCDGHRDIISSDDYFAIRKGATSDWMHYCFACWETGWYTGIEPKGGWPIAPKEDPWPDEVGHGAGDPVHSPSHYRWLPNGIEVIDITESFDFLIGNVLKYVLRAEHKGKPLEDWKKARWYLDRAIANRERDNDNSPAVE